MPADFHFIRPEWLLAIPVAIVIAVLLARRQLGAGHWRDVIDPALMPHVLSRKRGRGIHAAINCIKKIERSRSLQNLSDGDALVKTQAFVVAFIDHQPQTE